MEVEEENEENRGFWRLRMGDWRNRLVELGRGEELLEVEKDKENRRVWRLRIRGWRNIMGGVGREERVEVEEEDEEDRGFEG